MVHLGQRTPSDMPGTAPPTLMLHLNQVASSHLRIPAPWAPGLCGWETQGERGSFATLE